MKRILSSLALVLIALTAFGSKASNLQLNFTNVGKENTYIHWSLPQNLATSPTSLAFGTVTIGQTVSLNVTLLNDGTVPIAFPPTISITGTNPGDFGFVSQCPTQLIVNAQCTIVTTFTPKAAGARSAQLNIPFQSGLPGSPPSLSILLARNE